MPTYSISSHPRQRGRCPESCKVFVFILWYPCKVFVPTLAYRRWMLRLFCSVACDVCADGAAGPTGACGGSFCGFLTWATWAGWPWRGWRCGNA